MSTKRFVDALRRPSGPHGLRWIALLLVCAAYLQGGLTKGWNFAGAVAEMQHFDLQPAEPLAMGVIVLELGAVALILSGYGRWIGAFALALFTVAASFIANRFWEAPPEAQSMMTNAFFEHLGLAGAFLLIAWHDLAARWPAEPR